MICHCANLDAWTCLNKVAEARKVLSQARDLQLENAFGKISVELSPLETYYLARSRGHRSLAHGPALHLTLDGISLLAAEFP